MTELLAHSPLGASGMYRWVPCPGSVRQSYGIVDEESEFAALGTAAHAVAAFCLEREIDAWQEMGAVVYNGKLIDPKLESEAASDKLYISHAAALTEDIITVDPEMAVAVQVYLDAIRQAHPDRDQVRFFIERRFHCPEVHPLCYGTSDATYIDAPARTLHVWDYKNGAGIVVEVQMNPQCMYYGVGMLTDLMLWDDIDTVVLHIAQPNGWHFMGPVREWSISTTDLAVWRDEVMVPAMDRAETDDTLQSGEHCRFCPARSHACPALMNDYYLMEKLMEKMAQAGGAAALDNETVARILDLNETVKIGAKAARETAFARAQKGATIPGWKLVKGRVNRIWKDTAEKAVVKLFGADAYEPQKLKSPAQIEKMPQGKAIAAKYAFKPEGDQQLVKATESRPEQSPKTKAKFEPIKPTPRRRKK
jgi:hypothetical protein